MSIYRYAQIFYWPFVWRGRRRRHIDVSSNIVGCNFGWQQTMAIMIIIWPMRETSSPKVKQYQTSASARLLCSNRTPSIIARLERVANLIGRFFCVVATAIFGARFCLNNKPPPPSQRYSGAKNYLYCWWLFIGGASTDNASYFICSAWLWLLLTPSMSVSFTFAFASISGPK